MTLLQTPISIGELLDKITILEIKQQRISDPAKRVNIDRELSALQGVWAASGLSESAIRSERDDLKAVNERLWDIEDAIRFKERDGAFDAEFIALARAVYIENDERAALKKAINLALGSALVEEKSYAPYRRET
jgi:hypothetical protein